MLPNDSYFRAGAGIVIFNDQYEVLVFERADIPGAWQSPQGGLDAGECPGTGAVRELFEETAITKDQIKIVDEYPGWLSYELPNSKKFNQEYRGQNQKWFFAQAKENLIVDLDAAQDKEFSNWKWVSHKEWVETIVDFKRPMYRQLLAYFEKNIIK